MERIEYYDGNPIVYDLTEGINLPGPSNDLHITATDPDFQTLTQWTATSTIHTSDAISTIDTSDYMVLTGEDFVPMDCKDNQFLTLKNGGEVVCKDLPKWTTISYTWKDQPHTIIKEVPMDFNLTNVLIIVFIAFVTAKWLVPKFTLRFVFKGFINLVMKPFRRTKRKVKREWDLADKD